MEIEFLDNALDDLEFWKKSGNRTIQLRIERLLENICQTPFSGIGKPEPLKHDFIQFSHGFARTLDSTMC